MRKGGIEIHSQVNAVNGRVGQEKEEEEGGEGKKPGGGGAKRESPDS